MNAEIPYLTATGNLPKILDAVQKAGAPATFNVDFLKDLGFTSSQDRPTPKLFKYLGLLDGSGHPQAAYREFMDSAKAKKVLATRIRAAFDDLFLADKNAHQKSAEQLKGWFRTKTGASDSVADKIARTFKALATYADFNAPTEERAAAPATPDDQSRGESERGRVEVDSTASGGRSGQTGASKSHIGLVYRFEIHLPDTQNVDTFRAIFRALREELM